MVLGLRRSHYERHHPHHRCARLPAVRYLGGRRLNILIASRTGPLRRRDRKSHRGPRTVVHFAFAGLLYDVLLALNGHIDNGESDSFLVASALAVWIGTFTDQARRGLRVRNKVALDI